MHNSLSRRELFGAAAAALTVTAWAGGAQTPGEFVLVRDGKAEAVIVLPDNPTPAEQRGARELIDFVRRMSGAGLEIADEAGDKSEIRIAFDPALGDEAYTLRTEGQRLTITGGRPRGVLYGCHALLDRLGVRWLTRTVTVVPRRATVSIPPLDERGAPAFGYRHAFIAEADDPDWAARNRLNGAMKTLDASHGGSVRIEPFVHSLDQIVPGEMFATHPEYFPMIRGERSPGTAKGGQVYPGSVQRCLSNPDVVKLAVAKVREWIAAVPDAQILSVSQNDGDGWCECPACRTLEQTHGGTSGALVAFVNEVAAAIEEEHPDKLIDTLAYGQTEAPPTSLAPRRNVRVRLCPIHVCHAHPVESCASPESAAFRARLGGWAALTDSPVVWHYAIFTHTLMPFPDFASLPADLRLYRKHGVTGVFLQGTSAPCGSDAELRAWVAARLLWNPDLDADALVTEWMRGVYGAAWEPMRAWFDALHRTAASNSTRHLYLQDAPSAFPDEVLAAGDDLFDKAERLADSDAARDAVAKARLSLRYVQLDRAKQPGGMLDEFVHAARRFGVTQVAEGRSLEDWEAEVRRRAK